MVNWSSFYILKLNIRKSLNVSYTYSHPPSPPNPFCHQLPTSQGNYEVHPGNKDNPRVRATCETNYCDFATYLLFLDFLWGHPNPCEVLQFRILRIAHEFQFEFISKFLKSKGLLSLSFTLNFQLRRRFFTEKQWFAKALNFSDAKWLDQESCHCNVQCNLIEGNKVLHGWKILGSFLV